MVAGHMVPSDLFEGEDADDVDDTGRHANARLFLLAPVVGGWSLCRQAFRLEYIARSGPG